MDPRLISQLVPSYATTIFTLIFLNPVLSNSLFSDHLYAAGVLNTCKSNEALYLIFFGNEDFVTEWRTGE